jgi:hypothetical protein
VFTRPGYERKADVGTSAKIDTIITEEEYGVMFMKSGTAIQQSVDETNWYDIGVTRTATERDFLYPFRGEVYATNETDSFLRIAISKANGAIADTDTEITVDDISKFASGGGTVYIRGDAIAYTGVSSNDLTGVTGIVAGGHPDNSIITQTSTPSGAPSGVAISDLEGSLLVLKDAVVHYSAPATLDNPEFAYDFSGNGAGKQAISGKGTALQKITGGVIIGHVYGMDYAYTFNPATNGLLTRPLSDRHSIPNAFCLTQGDKMVYAFTGDRILPITSSRDGVQIIEDPFNDNNNMDYPVRELLSSADQTQTFSFNHYDPVRSEVSTAVFIDGISQELVYSEDLGVYSIDTGKSFGCKTNFKGNVIAGSDSDDKIYRDNTLTTDDTIPIFHRVLTGVYNIDDELLTSDYLSYVFRGLLSGAGSFTFRVYVDGDLADERVVAAADLENDGLMSTTTGKPIGGGNIGAETIGFGDTTQDAYRFTYPYEMFNASQSIQFEFEVFDEGTSLELRKSKLGAEHSNLLELTNQ